MKADTSEKAFQNDIITHLTSTGYQKRNTYQNYNKTTCLDLELTLKFIKDTQEKEWKKWIKVYGKKAEQKFFLRLISEIEKKGQFIF